MFWRVTVEKRAFAFAGLLQSAGALVLSRVDCGDWFTKFVIPAVRGATHGNDTFGVGNQSLTLTHISEPTRQAEIPYAVFCLKKKKLSPSYSWTPH